MEARFNKLVANLRTYLRKRGAVIDVKCKTVLIDVEVLNKKELERLEELKRWGYSVNAPLPLQFKDDSMMMGNNVLVSEEWLDIEESFVAFADEIMAMYY